VVKSFRALLFPIILLTPNLVTVRNMSKVNNLNADARFQRLPTSLSHEDKGRIEN